MPESLPLDQFLPTWDHEISVSQLFRVTPAGVFDAITNLDLYRLPLARVLLEARGLPRPPGRRGGSATRREGRVGATNVPGSRPS